jgi:hypothetical protein
VYARRSRRTSTQPPADATLQNATITVRWPKSYPAAIAREIADQQAGLLRLAKDKTEQLYLASFPTALPDVRKGIRIKAS